MTEATDLPEVVRTDKRFEIRVGEDVAFAEYRVRGDSVIFPHTVVPEAFAGQGVGKRLVEAGRSPDPARVADAADLKELLA